MAFFASLKQNFIAYLSSKVSSRLDCIFEIHQLWQSGFSRVYSNCCCSCWFEPEIIKIGQSSHKMYSNNIVNFQEPTPILNACTRKSGNLLNAPSRFFSQLKDQGRYICLWTYHSYRLLKACILLLCWAFVCILFWPILNDYHYYYYYYSFGVFHSVSWLSFTGVWVTANLLKSPGLFSVFWLISIM